MIAHFAIPGDLSAPTGGYEYDRRVLQAAESVGFDLRVLPLGGGFPDPNRAEEDAALEAIEASQGPVLVDGLALGALHAARLPASVRNRLCALCHHPLGLEPGLDPDEAARRLDVESAALRACAQVITTSETTAATVREMFGLPADKVTVAPPGLDPAPLAPRRGRPPRILGVGTVSVRKGWDVLAEALAELVDLDWRCFIAGATDREPDAAEALRARLARLGLSDRVALLGALDRETLDRMYADADLFCLPSRHEGFGMVIAEAMMRGLPVVSTTAGAIPEAAGGAASLVPPDDPHALSEALRRLLEDDDERDRLSAAGRIRAEALPRWDDTARIIAGVLRRLG